LTFLKWQNIQFANKYYLCNRKHKAVFDVIDAEQILNSGPMLSSDVILLKKELINQRYILLQSLTGVISVMAIY